MNRRILIVLVFGLAFAGSASIVLYKLMASRISQSASAAESRPVVVAVHDIQSGSLIREQDVKVAPWIGPIPDGVILNQRDAVGRSVIATIYTMEPLTRNHLAVAGSGGGLAAFIPVGMRAVAVKVNDVVNVSGFVVPGSHVDVIATAQPKQAEGETKGTVARTVLQNITVISAGQEFRPNADGKPVAAHVVNLLVTPSQAEILSLVGNETTIQLILRNDSDKELVRSSGIGLDHLLSEEPGTAPQRGREPQSVRASIPPVPPAPPPEPVLKAARSADAGESIEIIRGTKSSEVRIATEEVH